MHLYFLVFVDYDVQEYAIFTGNVFSLDDIHRCVLEAFFFEVALYNRLGAIHDIRRDVATGLQAEACFDVLTLRFLDAGIIDAGNARLRCELDAEIYLSIDNAVGSDGNI